MNFSLSDEQEQLRSSVRSFLRDHYTFELRQAAIRSPSGLRPEIWASFADLGLLSMSLPARVGGLELDPASTMVVMEELGRALVIEPYIETIVLCGALLARAGGSRADHVLSQIGQGKEIVAFASAEPTARDHLAAISTCARRHGSEWRLDGVKSVVVAASWATQLLVAARTGGGVGERSGLSLFLVDKAARGVSLNEYPTIDGRRAADVVFNGVLLPADALVGHEGQAIDAIERAVDEAMAAVGAEAIGVLVRMHEDTLEYTKQRRQFGQPIGRFQALQHRLVDMYMEIELARSAVYLATLKLAAPRAERALAASAAKVTVSKACRFVGQNAVQMHGGIGLTDELAISHHFKRATAIELELGSVDFHLARYSALQRQPARVHAER